MARFLLFALSKHCEIKSYGCFFFFFNHVLQDVFQFSSSPAIYWAPTILAFSHVFTQTLTAGQVQNPRGQPAPSRWSLRSISCTFPAWPLGKSHSKESFWRGSFIHSFKCFLFRAIRSSVRVGGLNGSKERTRKRSCRTQGAVVLSGSGPGAEEPLWVLPEHLGLIWAVLWLWNICWGGGWWRG